MSGSHTFEPEVQAAIMMDPAKRDPLQAMMCHTAEPRVSFDEEPTPRTLRTLKGDDGKRYAELKKQLARIRFPEARASAARAVHDRHQRHCAPDLTSSEAAIPPLRAMKCSPASCRFSIPTDAKITPPSGLNSTGRRSALANWLTDPKNPLPARVMVNRIWNYHFGRGIVATPGDFGRMGSRPTHPELLDYLAATFVEDGWSMKKLHRMILLSNTYQQSSDFQAKSAETDPDDNLLWRYPRHRLEAEAIRDSMLSVSGLLNPQMGGPGVFPPVPAGTLSDALRDGGGGRLEDRKGRGAEQPSQRLHLCAAQPALSHASGIRLGQYF